MNTKVNKVILKDNWWLVALPVLFLLLGVFLSVLPNRTIDYASLQTKQVTVETLKYHLGGNGSSYHDIRTTDGERYVVKGDYNRNQLEEVLIKGRIITIKWYKSDFGGLCAEEVYVDGEQVVIFNDDFLNNNIRLIVSAFAIVLGIGGLCIANRILKSLSEQKTNTAKLHKKRKL